MSDALMENLRRANEVRIARSELKQRLKRGEITALEVLREATPFWLEQMTVEDLLMAQRKFQRRVLNRLLRRSALNSGSTIGGLSRRQLGSLLTDLGEWEDERDLRARYRRSRAAA